MITQEMFFNKIIIKKIERFRKSMDERLINFIECQVTYMRMENNKMIMIQANTRPHMTLC